MHNGSVFLPAAPISVEIKYVDMPGCTHVRDLGAARPVFSDKGTLHPNIQERVASPWVTQV